MRLLVYPIHVGSIFGRATQILALLVSMLVVVSAITGVLLWWQKQTPERHARDPYPSLPKSKLISSRKP
jgi:uncharacterized iron-regulated membrane protein